MFPKKERTQKEYQELVRAMAWNDDFGCYTRAGFEHVVWPEILDRARWIIYLDIDGLHAINDAHGGYEYADALIKQVFGILRLTDYIAGQYKSGDEFLICLTEKDFNEMGQREVLDPQGMMERLIDALKKHEMSATFAIVPVISHDLVTNVKPAVDQVYAAKKQRGDRR